MPELLICSLWTPKKFLMPEVEFLWTMARLWWTIILLRFLYPMAEGSIPILSFWIRCKSAFTILSLISHLLVSVSRLWEVNVLSLLLSSKLLDLSITMLRLVWVSFLPTFHTVVLRFLFKAEGIWKCSVCTFGKHDLFGSSKILGNGSLKVLINMKSSLAYDLNLLIYAYTSNWYLPFLTISSTFSLSPSFALKSTI
jgi:hypothetical protein